MNVTMPEKEVTYMAIIQQFHKDTNTTYVYESESYWDPEKRQSRSRRKCIGKIDPETGEMIPTGKRGRAKNPQNENTETSESSKLQALLQSAQEEILSLKTENAELKAALKKEQHEHQVLVDAFQKIQNILKETL